MKSRPIVILTALELEYAAVRQGLVHPMVRTHEHGTRFEVGRLADGGAEIALALVGKGNHSAAVLAERAITVFAPAALIFVGVAGALHTNIELGDLVVATHIYAYHGATSEDDGAKSRPRIWERAFPRLLWMIAELGSNRKAAWYWATASGRRPGVRARALPRSV